MIVMWTLGSLTVMAWVDVFFCILMYGKPRDDWGVGAILSAQIVALLLTWIIFSVVPK